MTDFFDELEEQAYAEADLMRVPAVTLRNTVPATDETIMTFGKYRGMKVKDVPAQYLIWWFKRNPTHFPELVAYIAKNKKVLEEEAEVLGDQHHSGVDNRWDLDDDYWRD